MTVDTTKNLKQKVASKAKDMRLPGSTTALLAVLQFLVLTTNHWFVFVYMGLNYLSVFYLMRSKDFQMSMWDFRLCLIVEVFLLFVCFHNLSTGRSNFECDALKETEHVALEGQVPSYSYSLTITTSGTGPQASLFFQRVLSDLHGDFKISYEHCNWPHFGEQFSIIPVVELCPAVPEMSEPLDEYFETTQVLWTRVYVPKLGTELHSALTSFGGERVNVFESMELDRYRHYFVGDILRAVSDHVGDRVPAYPNLEKVVCDPVCQNSYVSVQRSLLSIQDDKQLCDPYTGVAHRADNFRFNFASGDIHHERVYDGLTFSSLFSLIFGTVYALLMERRFIVVENSKYSSAVPSISNNTAMGKEGNGEESEHRNKEDGGDNDDDDDVVGGGGGGQQRQQHECCEREENKNSSKRVKEEATLNKQAWDTVAIIVVEDSIMMQQQEEEEGAGGREEEEEKEEEKKNGEDTK